MLLQIYDASGRAEHAGSLVYPRCAPNGKLHQRAPRCEGLRPAAFLSRPGRCVGHTAQLRSGAGVSSFYDRACWAATAADGIESLHHLFLNNASGKTTLPLDTAPRALCPAKKWLQGRSAGPKARSVWPRAVGMSSLCAMARTSFPGNVNLYCGAGRQDAHGCPGYGRSSKTVCPSGLRGWTQVPLAQAAWVQIPQLSYMMARLGLLPPAMGGSCR